MKTTLIAGKDYPAGTAYSTFASETERNVLITLPAGVELDSGLNMGAHIDGSAWNRSSSIAPRTALLKALNLYKSLDECVLIFDAQYYAPDYNTLDLTSFSHVIDDLIAGYCYMALEIANYFEKQGKGKMVFVLKASPTGANPTRSGPEIRPASIPLAVAQDAFIALAENFASRFEGTGVVQSLLVRSDNNSDNEIATWLFPFLDEIDGTKISGWQKVGAKARGGFSFFK